MPATGTEYGPFDEMIHHADGSHRTTVPQKWSSSPEAWEARQKAHIAQHIKEAMDANDMLRQGGLGADEELAVLADQASQITQGRVYFLYDTISIGSGTIHYIFQGVSDRAGSRFARRDAINALKRVIHEAQNQHQGM